MNFVCRALRAATFIGSGMSGLLPVVHMLYIGLEGNWISVQYILLMGFLYAAPRAFMSHSLPRALTSVSQLHLRRHHVRVPLPRDFVPWSSRHLVSFASVDAHMCCGRSVHSLDGPVGAAQDSAAHALRRIVRLNSFTATLLESHSVYLCSNKIQVVQCCSKCRARFCCAFGPSISAHSFAAPLKLQSKKEEARLIIILTHFSPNDCSRFFPLKARFSGNQSRYHINLLFILHAAISRRHSLKTSPARH